MGPSGQGRVRALFLLLLVVTGTLMEVAEANRIGRARSKDSGHSKRGHLDAEETLPKDDPALAAADEGGEETEQEEGRGLLALEKLKDRVLGTIDGAMGKESSKAGDGSGSPGKYADFPMCNDLKVEVSESARELAALLNDAQRLPITLGPRDAGGVERCRTHLADQMACVAAYNERAPEELVDAGRGHKGGKNFRRFVDDVKGEAGRLGNVFGLGRTDSQQVRLDATCPDHYSSGDAFGRTRLSRKWLWAVWKAQSMPGGEVAEMGFGADGGSSVSPFDEALLNEILAKEGSDVKDVVLVVQMIFKMVHEPRKYVPVLTMLVEDDWEATGIDYFTRMTEAEATVFLEGVRAWIGDRKPLTTAACVTYAKDQNQDTDGTFQILSKLQKPIYILKEGLVSTVTKQLANQGINLAAAGGLPQVVRLVMNVLRKKSISKDEFMTLLAVLPLKEMQISAQQKLLLDKQKVLDTLFRLAGTDGELSLDALDKLLQRSANFQGKVLVLSEELKTNYVDKLCEMFDGKHDEIKAKLQLPELEEEDEEDAEATEAEAQQMVDEWLMPLATQARLDIAPLAAEAKEAIKQRSDVALRAIFEKVKAQLHNTKIADLLGGVDPADLASVVSDMQRLLEISSFVLVRYVKNAMHEMLREIIIQSAPDIVDQLKINGVSLDDADNLVNEATAVIKNIEKTHGALKGAHTEFVNELTSQNDVQSNLAARQSPSLRIFKSSYLISLYVLYCLIIIFDFFFHSRKEVFMFTHQKTTKEEEDKSTSTDDDGSAQHHATLNDALVQIELRVKAQGHTILDRISLDGLGLTVGENVIIGVFIGGFILHELVKSWAWQTLGSDSMTRSTKGTYSSQSHTLARVDFWGVVPMYLVLGAMLLRLPFVIYFISVHRGDVALTWEDLAFQALMWLNIYKYVLYALVRYVSSASSSDVAEAYEKYKLKHPDTRETVKGSWLTPGLVTATLVLGSIKTNNLLKAQVRKVTDKIGRNFTKAFKREAKSVVSGKKAASPGDGKIADANNDGVFDVYDVAVESYKSGNCNSAQLPYFAAALLGADPLLTQRFIVANTMVEVCMKSYEASRWEYVTMSLDRTLDVFHKLTTIMSFYSVKNIENGKPSNAGARAAAALAAAQPAEPVALATLTALQQQHRTSPLPGGLKSWSVDKAAAWVGQFNPKDCGPTAASNYTVAFLAKGVDGELLEFATHDVLAEIGVASALDRARILRGLQEEKDRESLQTA